MPADLNRVTLVGRLTRDPEVRRLPSGDPLCSIRLAVSTRARQEDGSWGDRSNYFDVTVFGRQAETVSSYLSKGRRIGVDGRLSWREWQTQDGGKRQSVEVIAGDVFFLDSRRDSEGASPAAASGWDAAPARAPEREMATAGAGNGAGGGAGGAGEGEGEGGDDDIPF